MNIIAFYLPQFHSFPENDKWWGKGFTEWNNVRSAVPYIRNQIQPRIPLNNNYYDLSDVRNIKWQAKIAKEYGIYGFCIYHYWFDETPIMDTPLRLLNQHKEIDINYCLSWANEDWTRAWANKSTELLKKQKYGNESEWDKHYQYFSPYFHDRRYMQIDNKPILVIYRPELIPCRKKMLERWQELAKKDGFAGITLIYQRAEYASYKDNDGDLFDYGIEYYPNAIRIDQKRTIHMVVKKTLNVICCKLKIPLTYNSSISFSYDDTWRRILTRVPQDNKMFPGAYVNWDNTPRHHQYGSFDIGYSTEKFKNYMKAQVYNARHKYKKDYLFIFAWNEWGEGGFLEPDEHEGFGRLQAIKYALESNGEFPMYV